MAVARKKPALTSKQIAHLILESGCCIRTIERAYRGGPVSTEARAHVADAAARLDLPQPTPPQAA